MRAKDVKSPISTTRNHNVLFESPFSWDEEFSIVEAEVLDDDGTEWNRSLGMRWDGDRRDDDSKGFPNSSGKAVWFWIPKTLEPFFRGIIIPTLLERRGGEQRHKKLASELKEIKLLLMKQQPDMTAAKAA
jgi:hypothetical protein